LDTDRDLCLDRIEIEEAGPNPAKLAAAIHDQLGEKSGAVPVHAIAKALDIDEIRTEPLNNIEGALVAPIERGFGSILVNANSSRQRQRFTIAHELDHFLNPWHVPTEGSGFRCSRDDIQRGGWNDRPGLTRHQHQEAEANRFAVELLLPASRFGGRLSSDPNINTVLTVANACDVSREAAARRYVELHDAAIAIAFSHEGRLRYWAAQPEFPRAAIRNADPMPDLPQRCPHTGLGDLEDADPADWLLKPDGAGVTIQTLHQQGGFAMTLVILDKDIVDDEEDDSVEDAYSRLSRF
jgi:hypothetical protein